MDFHSVVRYLVDEKAVDLSIRSPFFDDSTALTPAFRYGSLKVAGFLIDRGILRFCSEPEISEVLFTAARAESVHVLDILRRVVNDTDIDINVCRNPVSGNTVLHEAANLALDRNMLIPGHILMLRCVLMGYPDVTAAQVEGNMQLQNILSAEWNDLDTVRFLCSLGADARGVRNFWGESALDLVGDIIPQELLDDLENSVKDAPATDSPTLKSRIQES